MFYIYLLGCPPSLTGLPRQRVCQQLHFCIARSVGYVSCRNVCLKVSPIQPCLVARLLPVTRHRCVPDGDVEATTITTIPVVKLLDEVGWSCLLARRRGCWRRDTAWRPGWLYDSLCCRGHSKSHGIHTTAATVSAASSIPVVSSSASVASVRSW